MVYQELYKILLSIYDCYNVVFEYGERIYKLLKVKQLEEVQSLQIEQLKTLEQLKELKASLEETLTPFCRKHHIEKISIRALFPYYSNEEKENIKKIQDKIKKIEQETKKSLLRNQYYLEVSMKTTEDIIDFVSEMNMEKAHNSQLFMNELL